MKIINTSESLWSFALAFYAREDVAETCLLLQDHHKVNVCLLIGLHWLDTKGCILSTADMADLSAHTQTWTQEIVEPLRSLRRILRNPVETFPSDELQEQVRGSIKQAELLAEKKLLVEIERWSTKISVHANPCSNFNINQYFTSLKMDEGFVESVIKKLTEQ